MFCLIGFVIRTTCRNGECLGKFTSKGLMKVVNPCLVLLTWIGFVVVFVVFTITLRVAENYEATQCALTEISEIIEKGDPGSGWGGTTAQITHL